jgi:NAD(P)-dependent dehydrogenase (short-subunit alcohol dehydrogenase family)
MKGRLTLDLGGRVGIVTGAGSGMGREVALRLSADGARIVLADIEHERVCETRDEIAARSGEAVAVKADVGREKDVRDVIDACMDGYGQIDFLVSNAGIVGPYDFEKTSVEEWDRVFAVNTRGGFLCAKHALHHMKMRKTGRVLFTASTNGAKPGGYVIAYRASKAALIMLARSLALHAAAFGVTVNAICPGVTATPMQRQLMETVLESEGISFDAYVAERKKRVPMGRFTEMRDIADAVEFLVSDGAGFITGQAIFVNGGEW